MKQRPENDGAKPPIDGAAELAVMWSAIGITLRCARAIPFDPVSLRTRPDLERRDVLALDDGQPVCAERDSILGGIQLAAELCGPAVSTAKPREARHELLQERELGRIARVRNAERTAADGTPVRDVVGDDPIEFAETFAQAYTGKRWIDKERARLTKAIEDAERGEQK